MTLERLSFTAGRTGTLAKVLCDPKLWMVHACLALLGGTFQVRQLLVVLFMRRLCRLVVHGILVVLLSYSIRFSEVLRSATANITCTV